MNFFPLRFFHTSKVRTYSVLPNLFPDIFKNKNPLRDSKGENGLIMYRYFNYV